MNPKRVKNTPMKPVESIREDALIIGAGNDLCSLKTIMEFNTIVCADGGYDHIENIIVPNAIVGDFDSIRSNKIGKNIEIFKFPKKKNYTDTELAVKYLIDNKFTHIYITGVNGSRPDHLHAAISLLEKYKAIDMHILTGNFDIFVILPGTRYEFSGMKNKIVSFFSLSASSNFIKSCGFAYEYKNTKLNSSDPIGVSNVIKSKKAVIKFNKGLLLCYLSI